MNTAAAVSRRNGPFVARLARSFTTTSPAAARNRITDKSRILEKPERFNPPSHGARLPRKRRLAPLSGVISQEERTAQASRRYPNMMPPEGSFMHWFLNSRGLHLWITLSTLTACAIYSLMLSFVSSTEFRGELPAQRDWFRHPLQSFGQFLRVYRMHVDAESAKVAEKRRQKQEDIAKRQEFLRVHGFEPGFLTGSWMERFGTVEQDEARKMAAVRKQESEAAAAAAEGTMNPSLASEGGSADEAEAEHAEQQVERRPRKRKIWLGIWG